MIIYTKGWTAKNVTSTPIVFDTKDIFYIKELGFSPRRSMVVLRDSSGSLVELTVEASAKELAEKWMKIGGSCVGM